MIRRELLRPTKVSNAVRRRVFEAALRRVRASQHSGVEDVGTSYGGWALPGGEIPHGGVAYCVGAGGDIHTDLELARRWGMTVRCIEPVEGFCAQAREESAGIANFVVVQAAVGVRDGPMRMTVSPHPGASSVSSAGLYLGTQSVTVQGRTVASLMRELGDTRIDLLKLDVEGAEYDVLPTLDLRGLGVGVFATQIHHNGGLRAGRQLIQLVRDQGYDLVGHRETIKLTFLRSGG